MLCSKCGYISFDNLTSCAKCQQDLTEIKDKLNGTAIQGERNYFLVIETAAEDELTPTDSPAEQEALEEALTEAPAEELTVNLDDMPPIDLSEISADTDTAAELAETITENDAEQPSIEFEDAATPQNEAEISAQPPEVEMEGIELDETQPAEDEIEMPPDTESLTLELNDEETDLLEPEAAAPEDENEAENNEAQDSQIPIDLDQIDLSDLTHVSDNTTSGHDPADDSTTPAEAVEEITNIKETSELELQTAPDSDSLIFDLGNQEDEAENLDLTLELEDVSTTEDDLAPIDLTLELDQEPEDINLSLDDILEETDDKE